MYGKLHNIAKQQLYKSNAGQTISPTILVHECYLRLTQLDSIDITNDTHLKRISAQCMRYYLIDHIRYKYRSKRKAELSDIKIETIKGDENQQFNLFQLEEIIKNLEDIDPKLAEITELKYLSGYTIEQLSEILSLSKHKTYKRWKLAKSVIKTMINQH